MQTVDWSKWGQLNPQGQAALLEEYRRIIRAEIQHARDTGFKAMNEALALRGSTECR